MLNHCSSFTISGGTFNIQPRPDVDRSHSASRSPQMFHFVRLGDLNLLAQISCEDVVEYREVLRRRTGVVVRRQREVVGSRAFFQAEVNGIPGTLTAVISRGKNVDKVNTDFSNDVFAHISPQWMTEIEKHETFRYVDSRSHGIMSDQVDRHPSLVQLHAVSVGRGMSALIYREGE